MIESSINLLKRPLTIGDYLKNITINEEKGIKIYDFLTDHLLLFVFSTDCKSCITTMELLYQFMEKNRHMNVIILINTPEEDFYQIKALFDDRVSGIFLVEKHILTKKIGVREMPRGYCINKLGQVLSHNNSFDAYWLGKLLDPISEIINFELLEEDVDEY